MEGDGRTMIDAAGRVGREGERSSSMLSITGQAAGAGPLAPGQRWSLARKHEVVLRLLRGEPVEAVSPGQTHEGLRSYGWGPFGEGTCAETLRNPAKGGVSEQIVGRSEGWIGFMREPWQTRPSKVVNRVLLMETTLAEAEVANAALAIRPA